MSRETFTTSTRNGIDSAYIPMLQNISPGELQSAQNALDFAKALVTDWLAKYKFQNWDTHSSTGKPVTDSDKKARAKEIADRLCDHGRWLTHGRSIKMTDLEEMRLKVTDYSKETDLSDAIHRYHTLLQMTFGSIYKVFETPDSQIYRFIQVAVPQAQQLQGHMKYGTLDAPCPKCKENHRIQANLDKSYPLEEGSLAFPDDNKLTCPNCENVIDLTAARKHIEMQTKKRVVPQKGA